jgi:hypothetical protein
MVWQVLSRNFVVEEAADLRRRKLAEQICNSGMTHLRTRRWS